MNTKIISFAFIVCAFLGAASVSVTAQMDEQSVAASGDRVRPSDVNTLIEFYEWAFVATFTAAERVQFQRLTDEDLRRDPAAAKKSTASLVASFQKVKALDDASRAAKREQFTPAFVEQMRSTPDDPMSQLLMSIYNRSQAGPTAAAASETISSGTQAADGTGSALGAVAELTGTWVWGHSGSSTYSTGGALMGSNGSRFTYKFGARGTVEYTGIMNVMSGGCRMQVFTKKNGRATLAGNTLTIAWSPADFTRDDSCSPSKNYTKKLAAETERFSVRFKDSYGQKQLCLTGKDETCYSPAN